MKKLLVVLLIIGVSVLPVGCKENTADKNRSEVTINSPTDDTVNGYRLGAPKVNSKDSVSADRVTVESKASSIPKTASDSEMPSDTVNIQYCANTKSLVFHKTTCGSAKNTKEENKYITDNREELITDGYTPCKKCNP